MNDLEATPVLLAGCLVLTDRDVRPDDRWVLLTSMVTASNVIQWATGATFTVPYPADLLELSNRNPSLLRAFADAVATKSVGWAMEAVTYHPTRDAEFKRLLVRTALLHLQDTIKEITA